MNSQLSQVVATDPRSDRHRYADSAEYVDSFALLQSIWHHKWSLILSSLLTVVVAAILLSLITPRFSATAKVLLNPRDTRVVTSQEVVSGLDLSDPVIESEVALIRSSVLLESVVREIGLENIPEFDPRVSTGSGWQKSLNSAFENAMSVFGIGTSSSTEFEAQEETTIVEGDNVHRQAVGMLRKYLTVVQQGNSYAISISATAQESEVVALLVNTIAERYISAQLEDRVESTRRAAEWLQASVEDLRIQVSEAEVAAEQSRAEKLATDGGSYDAMSQQLAAMSAQLANARADRAEAQARYDQIVEMLEAEGFTAVSEVLSSPFVISLRGTLSSMTRERAGLSSNFGADHPERIRLNAMITRLEEDLAYEVRKIIDGLESEVEVAAIRERSIAHDLLALEERASSMALSSVELRHLEREAQALRRQYDNMLARLKETRAHETLAREEAKVIEFALAPGQPSYPKFRLLLSAAAVLGAGFGLAAILFKELGATTYQSSSQILRDLRLQVLAALPSKDGRKFWRKSSGTDFDESIKRLYCATATREGEVPGVIAVTSSVAGEGARATAVGLARVVGAVENRRVIFVDLIGEAAIDGDDDRVQETPTSLSSTLRKNGSLTKAIQSDDTQNFDMLHVAEFEASVSNLGLGSNFSPIIKHLAQEYNLVVIAAPPVLESTLLPIILREANSLIYAVRWNKTKTGTVRQGLASLSGVGIVPSGIVLTEVDEARINNVHQGISQADLAGGIA